jgi:hypothetical protein
LCSDEAALTNVGRVLEARGRELIGEAYEDPVTSFRDFHKFSNENPEVIRVGDFIFPPSLLVPVIC